MKKSNIHLFLFLILAIPTVTLATSINKNAPSLDPKTVTATGRGEVFIPQTIASTKLTVSEDGKTAIEAQENVRTKSAKLLAVLKTQKTLNIETAAITVNPTMSYTDNKPKIIGYNASYSVSVKALIGNMGKIIDDAVNAGASIVDEPKLSASDAEITKAEKDAIKLATQDAKSRAEASLAALGFKYIAVNQITILNNNNHPQSAGPTLMRSSANLAETPPTQVISGKTNIVAEVSISLVYQ